MTSTTSPTTGLITFYDIAHTPPVEKSASSPNPWKTRYALNFKKVPYKTTWVPLPDVSTVRSALNIPASRTFADGSPYHTLPIISDPATGRIIGDSFEIAMYLQEQYPTSGAGDLFPEQDLDFFFKRDLKLFVPVAETEKADSGPTVAYVKFNTSVDSAFTTYVRLMVYGLPLDPATAEQSRAEFERRAGIPWALMGVHGEERANMLKGFEEALVGLAQLYKRDPNGPFLMGNRATYADCIVGGWLGMSRVTLPKEEWEVLRGWHDGVFGRLNDALEEFAQMY